MKILRLALLLSGLPLLPGCMTYQAIQSAKNPSARVVPDRVNVEKAAVSRDNVLLIYLNGSMTNSPRNTHFTLAIPLEQIETHADVYRLKGTNGTHVAWFGVSRNLIHEGWIEENSNDLEIVPLGSLISPQYAYPDGFDDHIPSDTKLLPNSTRTLYQVHLDGYLQFIYINASDQRAYTDLHVDPASYTPKVEPEYYLLLPVTVPLDIVTCPIQIPFFILVGIAMRHPGC